MKRVLIVDDDVAVTNYFRVFLMQTGLFEPTVVNDSRTVAGLLEESRFDVILLDMDMPYVSGMDIMRTMRAKGDTTPVVVLTGVSDVDMAVRAMKVGAFDYLIKPVEDDKLLEVIDAAMEHDALHRTIEDLPEELSRESLIDEEAFRNFRSQDPKMIRLFHQAEKLAASDLSIFIWGESGTGKEAVARAIHKVSPRRNKPFLAVEADGQDPEHFPSFFFGQARDWSGAREERTGLIEQANGGTIFLNNIDALQHPMQVRLKRAILTGEYYRENSTEIRTADVRMIVSSTHDLTSPEYRQSFSRDLLYHLMINSISIPPLRERAVDIPILAAHFLAEEAEKAGKTIETISPELLEMLSAYSFPDNIRELRTIVQAAVASSDASEIAVESLPPYIRQAIEPGCGKRGAFVPRTIEEVVREHARLAVAHFGNDRGKAADSLGIPAAELDRLVSGDASAAE